MLSELPHTAHGSLEISPRLMYVLRYERAASFFRSESDMVLPLRHSRMYALWHARHFLALVVTSVPQVTQLLMRHIVSQNCHVKRYRGSMEPRHAPYNELWSRQR